MAIITTWDIAPDYDKWGVDTYWTCDNWVQWHKQLKSHFGKEKAIAIWNYAYAQQGMFESALDCRTFNKAFRDYVKQEELDPYANVGAMAIILKPIGAGSDVVYGASDVVSGAGDFLSKFGKAITTVLFVGIVGVVGYYGYKIYKTSKS